MMQLDQLDNGDLDALAVENDRRAGDRMLRAVQDFLSRFVAYPCPHSLVAHTLWIAHAHLMDRWETTPRIAFLSPEPGSGKTRALEVTELLVPNPVCAVNVTPAYLFRKIGNEEALPTLLYDEIDTVFGAKAKDSEEIRGLLNAGHRRGAVAGRCVLRGKTVATEEIPAYCAVAMAGIGWLPDTILSRAVPIRMRRRKSGEPVEPFRRRLHAADGMAIRAQIEVWAAGVPSEVAWPVLPQSVQDRDADVWEPLMAVADLAGGEWPNRARIAAAALVAASKEAAPSLGTRLLADIRKVFEDKSDHDQLPTAVILAALAEMEEAPWSNLRGNPLDANGLSKLLREYGIKSRSIRVGSAVVRGYARADLSDAWDRYLPPLPRKAATPATAASLPQLVERSTVADVVPLPGRRRD